MKRIAILAIIQFSVAVLLAQNSFKAVIKDKTTLELLPGVTVAVSNNVKATTASNASGTVRISNLTAGTAIINFSYIGYKTQQLSITIPDTAVYTILMEQDEMALQNVTVVAST